MRISLRFPVLGTLLAAALLVVPGTAEAQSRQVLGTYTTNVNGPQGALKAVIVLKREGGAYAGTLSAEGFPTMPISSATPTDSSVMIMVDTPDGGVTVAIKFGAGDKVTGSVVYQGAEMPLDGTFAAAGAAPAGAVSGVGAYVMKTSEPLMGEPGFDVSCTIEKSPAGALAGTCGNPTHGSVPVSTVSVAGNVVTMSGDTPAGPLKITVTVTGAEAAGTVVLGSESAKLKGTYTPK